MVLNNKQRERKLAAIMFTDMVGYSALAQDDETLSLVLLEEHRVILRQIFPIHGGKEIETIGDAFLVEFSSALDAVNCAIDIQRELWERNKYEPIEEHINIRIGIHIGDVVHKDGNILGDGVNIAARIEPLARSCGICVSEDVARQVQNKIDYPLRKLDSKHLKNIQTPVEIYDVALSWLQDESKDSPDPKRIKFNSYLFTSLAVILVVLVGILTYLHLSDRSTSKTHSPWENSIAVLPFADFSPQKDQDYFCDGMTDQIITNLAQLE